MTIEPDCSCTRIVSGALEVAGRVAAGDPAGRQRAVRERAGHRNGHGGGHAEALALALAGRLRVVRLVDAEAVDNRAGELHIAAGADAVRALGGYALVRGDRPVEGTGVLGLANNNAP